MVRGSSSDRMAGFDNPAASSDPEQVIKALRSQRGSYKGLITKIETWAHTDDADRDVFEVEAKLEMLDSYYTTYEVIQERLEGLDANETKDREKTDSSVFKAKAKLKRLKFQLHGESRSVEANLDTSINPGQFNVEVTTPSEVPMPKVKPFDGSDYMDYPNFRNEFHASVDSRPLRNIPKVKKFSLLRDALRGPAFESIKHLIVDEENYSKALEILDNRYMNNRLIFESLMKKLIDIPKVSSTDTLRSVLDKISANLKALEGLKATKEQIGYGILIHHVLSRVDSTTLDKWEEVSCSKKDEFPSWDELEQFLENRAIMQESKAYINATKPKENKPSSSSFQKPSPLVNKSYVAIKSRCTLCKGECSQIEQCTKFKAMSPRDRYAWAKAHHHCITCLQKLPHNDKCSGAGCDKCRNRHHTLMHFEDTIPKTYLNDNRYEGSEKIQILGTVVIQMQSKTGEWIPARVLIDSGSMTHFITKRLASKLQIRPTKASTSIFGLFGGQEIRERAEVRFKSMISEFNGKLEALILPEFDHLHPSVKLSTNDLKIPSNLPLADPSFDVPQRVDGIIGVGWAYKLLMVGQIRLTDTLLLQKTHVGWIVAGEVNSTTPLPNKVVLFSGPNVSDHEELDVTLNRFWELDRVPPPKAKWSRDEKFCEDHFKQNTVRDEAGRFIVKLPFKRQPTELGNSFQLAKSRLIAVERKLANNKPLHEMYSEFLAEYERLGHMKQSHEPLGSLNYLPHHGVLRLDSTSTKLRVVFDASAPTSSGLSLNDLMPPGPTIQPTLFNILLRFRYHPIVLSADAVKMYRQFLVHPDDQKYQAILWRENNRLIHYKLQTVTYGTSSAPFLAVRCVNELASTESGYPIATEAVLNDMYVDNMLSGAENVVTAIEKYHQVTQLFLKGGIEMRKWTSNSPEVLKVIPSDHCDELKQIGEDEVIKTLGLNWNPRNDCFLYRIEMPNDKLKWTKRLAVSHTAKIFDPLGFFGPVVAKMKIFMQRLWLLKLHWDESLPQDAQTMWLKLINELPHLETVKIPRFVFYDSSHIQEVQLHCFADASSMAYGTVFYIRCILISGEVIVHNLCSRSRVAPLKKITLPRLELCGASLLADLFTIVWPTLSTKITKVSCWLDAQVALTWVTNSPHKYDDFIASRTTKIQEQTQMCIWKHIPGEFNPADILSRGATPLQLIKYKEWFTGPAFLYTPESEWNFTSPKQLENDDRLEHRKISLALYTKVEMDLVRSYKFHGDLVRVQKIFAYVARCLSFGVKGVKSGNYSNLRSKTEPTSIKLTPYDLERGLQLAIRIAQAQSLPVEYQLLKHHKELPRRSPLLKLAPFMDSFGLIRVGGRLEYAPDLTYDEKHPILLPKNHPLTFAIMYNYHWRHLHPGQRQLLAMVRRKFWPIGGAVLANRIVRMCARCTIAARKVFKQIMANLPEDRLTPFLRCFEVVGIDLFGPFLVKHKGRGTPRTVVYVAVFICFRTRAIQLHYVMGEDTESIINTLIRFISRAGRPMTIWSDNATNFKAADNVFKFVDWNKVDEWCRSTHRIEWKFIPARSPHFGGLWESSVKLAKKHFKRVVRNTVLHIDAFITLLAMIESVVNSRPITPLSINPQDGQPLTPAHFMIGGPLITLPDPECVNFPTTKMNYVRTWQHLTEIKNHWLKRWQTEVRQSFQSRFKWHSASKNIRLGKVVLMVEKNKSPYTWNAATITKLFPGRDGRVRAVEVTIRNNEDDENEIERTFKRAITELVPIPMDDDEDE